MNYPSLVLPKGVAWGYKKTPKYQTIIQTPQSGRGQVRASLQQSPIYEWELSWNYLKQNGVTTLNDFQYLQDFYEAVQGAFGSFIFDPSLYGFEVLGVGSDITQFNNGFSGIIQPKNNYALYSQSLANAVWARTQIASVTDAQPAPDAGLSADLIVTSGTANSLRQFVSGPQIGWIMTFSVWMKVASGTLSVELVLGDSLGNSVTTNTVTTTWTQFSVTRNTIGGTGIFVQIGGSGAPGSGASFYAAWAHLETGPTANVYYDSTSSSETQGTILPAQTTFPLWRSSAVFNSGTVTLLEMIQNISLLVGIYLNGTLQSSSSYTQTNFPAQVTFNSPPPAASQLVWAGNYNYLVHFSDDSNDFEQFMFELWELKTLKLEGVQL